MPMMCGMRSLPMMMGASKMMSSTTKNINVGLSMGKYVFKNCIFGAKVENNYEL